MNINGISNGKLLTKEGEKAVRKVMLVREYDRIKELHPEYKDLAIVKIVQENTGWGRDTVREAVK